MRILITGHAGFLGSYLTSWFLNDKHNVIGCDLKKINAFNDYRKFSQFKINLNNFKEIYSLFKKSRNIDVVIHVAAKQPLKKNFKFEEYLKANFYGTKNLMEVCKNFGVKKIIFCSSFSVYEKRKGPIKENILPKPSNAYGLSKYLTENLVKYFAYNFNMKTIILRFDGIYGQKQNTPGFIKTAFQHALKNKQLILFNKGKLKRDHVYIDDAVQAVKLAVKKINKFKFEIFNIGGANPASSLSIFKNIKSLITAQNCLMQIQMNGFYKNRENCSIQLGSF